MKKKKIITIIASPNARQQAWINFKNTLWKSYKRVMYYILTTISESLKLSALQHQAVSSYFMQINNMMIANSKKKISNSFTIYSKTIEKKVFEVWGQQNQL